jgi:nucleoside-diphosphate-sugar epimerase
VKILFTGASSFTGFWFVQTLCKAGHEVTATFTREPSDYTGRKAKRTQMLKIMAESSHNLHLRCVFSCEFGSENFLALLRTERYDVFCHHASEVGNYKDPQFHVISACEKNTKNIPAIAVILQQQHCSQVILTGTVFEQYEGMGEDNTQAGSAYGLSKGLSYEILKFYLQRSGINIGKVVIPNPFGPYEEERFTSYLMQTWFQHDTAVVQTPDYVRDNIHVSLLALVYRYVVEQSMYQKEQIQVFHPSQYVESQGAFTQRFASEMRRRLPLACDYQCVVQKDFSEPRIRVNTANATQYAPEWSEHIAWDALAEYYNTIYS